MQEWNTATIIGASSRYYQISGQIDPPNSSRDINLFERSSDSVLTASSSTNNFTSFTETQAVPFEAEETMGLVALGSYLFYRHRKKRKQVLNQ